MTCRSSAYCPQCDQMVADYTCNCAGICDRHGQVCTVPRDGVIDVRYKGKTTPHTKEEYRNQWCVGYYAWAPGSEYNGPPQWFTREPGHPTKTPWEVEWDRQIADQPRQQREWEQRHADIVFETLQTEGGGI